MRITQEFYCAKSGGGCGGYIRVRLNMALNGPVEIACPKCNHKHRRILRDGVLYDSFGGDDRYDKEPTQEICPTLAAWTKKARHPESKRRAETGSKERHAVVIDDDPVARSFLADREHELWG